MVKREDRTGLNVSVETRKRVLQLLYDLQADTEKKWTQDDVVRYLLDDWEKHHIVHRPRLRVVDEELQWWNEELQKWV